MLGLQTAYVLKSGDIGEGTDFKVTPLIMCNLLLAININKKMNLYFSVKLISFTRACLRAHRSCSSQSGVILNMLMDARCCIQLHFQGIEIKDQI